MNIHSYLKLNVYAHNKVWLLKYVLLSIEAERLITDSSRKGWLVVPHKTP